MELGIHLAQQTIQFLQSILLGAVLGILYDIFRITRLAVKTSKKVVFIEDVIFFIFCSAISFLFLMSILDGKLRLFLFIGMALGAIQYFFTFSIIIIKISNVLIKIIKTLLNGVNSFFLQPIYKMLYRICRQFLRPIRFLLHFLKKTCQICKYRLKVWFKMMYNKLSSTLMPKDVKKRKYIYGKQKKKP